MKNQPKPNEQEILYVSKSIQAVSAFKPVRKFNKNIFPVLTASREDLARKRSYSAGQFLTLDTECWMSNGSMMGKSYSVTLDIFYQLKLISSFLAEDIATERTFFFCIETELS